MAASTTTGIQIPVSAQFGSAPGMLQTRRRRITPQAGHALEILGHSIEYLTDEFVHEGGALNAHDSQLEAIQLLMALNRNIYYECPTVPTFAERCHALLGIRAS
jgi:hypothetical protein